VVSPKKKEVKIIPSIIVRGLLKIKESKEEMDSIFPITP
jgi:hypothetical protein